MKSYWLAAFIFLYAGAIVAQERELYIAKYRQKFIVSGFFAKDILFISLDNNKTNTTYMPNNPAKLGVGFSWKNSVLNLAYGFDFMRDKKLGKTRSLDLQFHRYAKSYVADFFMQRYKGFYREGQKGGAEYIMSPDLELQQYGIHGQYVFNHKRFSYKAAYVHNEKQLRSAGSFLLGGGIYYTNIRSDSSFIYSNFSNFQFGVSLGYTYTWVIGKKWFINGTLTTGINFGNEHFSKIGKQKLEVYPTVFPRMSVGYDHDTWSLGFTYLSNNTYPVFSENIQMGLLSGKFVLSYYRRINDIPFLSKWLDKKGIF